MLCWFFSLKLLLLLFRQRLPLMRFPDFCLSCPILNTLTFLPFFGRTLHISKCFIHIFAVFAPHAPAPLSLLGSTSNVPFVGSPTNSLPALSHCNKCTLWPAQHHEMKVKVEKWVWVCRSRRVDGEFEEEIIGWQAGRQASRDPVVCVTMSPPVFTPRVCPKLSHTTVLCCLYFHIL